jgi:hypothetical protein
LAWDICAHRDVGREHKSQSSASAA